MYQGLSRRKSSATCRHALKCRRAAPRLPRRDQRCHVALVRLSGINGEIVLRETMHGVKVRASLSGAPVTPVPFPTLQLWQRTVYPDEEHVKWRQQLDQISQPLLLLNDVIHDQVGACLGEGWQTAMEPVKDSRAHACPVESAVSNARHRQGVGLAQVIKRPMQKRLWQLLLQRAREGRFPCARRTVDQDDLAQFPMVVHRCQFR